MRDKLIRLRQCCVELGYLSSASNAIGYAVFLNEQGDTLEDRKNLLRNEIDDLMKEIIEATK